MDGRDTAMKTIKVEKKRLLAQLHENLEKHKLEYAEAMVGFRKEQARLLLKLEDVVTGCVQNPNKETRKKVSDAYYAYDHLDVPANHTTSYAKAITWAEWTKGGTVKLSMNDFQCYVEDDWKWKRTFRNSVSTYANNG